MSTVQKALDIISEAISLEPEELQDHETWTFLGFTGLLVKATTADLKGEGITVQEADFERYETVGSFKQFLQGAASTNPTAKKPEPSDPWYAIPKPKVPVSVVLQGWPESSRKTIFLFPDGSGAGTAYSTLPPLSEDGSVCLIALNSPFLRQAKDFTCSIERMALLWLGELQRLQPKGQPYILGGWSAGGYFAFEVTKLLVEAGSIVERLILIDSPCRLHFAALPVHVIQQLTAKGLLGGKKPPEWMVSHFTSTVLSVEKYIPVPMAREHVPAKVNFIWAQEGLVQSVAESGLEVDFSVNITKFLLEPRGELGTEGWEKLLPGAEYRVDYMTGHHFQVAQPPHCENLGNLLKNINTV